MYLAFSNNPKFRQEIENGAVQSMSARAITAAGVDDINLAVTDGTITFDYTAATRRTIQMTLSDPTRSLVPDLATDKLSPYGQRLRVYMGPANYQVPMGVYYLEETDADDQGSSFELMIKGFDRSGKIARHALTAVYTIANGTNVASAIQSLLNFVEPGIVYNFSGCAYSLPQTILDINQDPWAAALQMAQAAGMDLFFDRNGICVLRPTPNPANLAPSWVYSDTKQGYGIMMDELQKVTVADSTVYNDVIVTAEASGATAVYSGRAKDTDPNSPTYINGPFGDVPIFFKSSIITSDAQAQALANSKLLYYAGRAQQVAIIGPPNPAQDEEDVVRVMRAKMKTNALYTIDKCDWQISPTGENTLKGSNTGQQTLTCRRVVGGVQ